MKTMYSLVVFGALTLAATAWADSQVQIRTTQSNAQGMAIVGQVGQITAMWQVDQLNADSQIFRATFIRVRIPDAYLNGSDAASIQRGPVEFDLAPRDVIAVP